MKGTTSCIIIRGRQAHLSQPRDNKCLPSVQIIQAQDVQGNESEYGWSDYVMTSDSDKKQPSNTNTSVSGGLRAPPHVGSDSQRQAFFNPYVGARNGDVQSRLRNVMSDDEAYTGHLSSTRLNMKRVLRRKRDAVTNGQCSLGAVGSTNALSHLMTGQWTFTGTI